MVLQNIKNVMIVTPVCNLCFHSGTLGDSSLSQGLRTVEIHYAAKQP